MNYVNKWRNRSLGFGIAGVLVFVLALIFGLNMPQTGAAHANAPTPSPSPSGTPSGTPAPPANGCPAAYKQAADPHTGGKVITKNADDYVAFFGVGTTTASGDKIATFLLQQSGKYVNALAVYAHAMGLYADPNKWQPLFKNNCLSPEGQKLHDQLEGALKAHGTTLTLGDAPTNGYNSGFSNGTYGVEASQGVAGDRTGIQVRLADGTIFWIMKRCSNPVFPGKPSLPTIPSTLPPPPPPPPGTPPTVHTCPPSMPHGTWPVCKDDPSQDPAPQGNAPTGGGQNADPGPGTYQPPATVQQPPSTPYHPPAPPAPVVPQPAPGPAPAPVPTPDPQPAPSPQPSAPAPSDPVSGCVPIPNVQTCP